MSMVNSHKSWGFEMIKTIALTKGKVALVDDDDYDWINQWKWNASYDGHGT